MKKIVCCVLVLIVCTVLLLTAWNPREKTVLYPSGGIVEVIDDTVYITDSTGNVWSFYGSEDWQTGDYAAMIMDNNGTDTIYDDVILQVCYIG